MSAVTFADNTYYLGQAKTWGVKKSVVLDLPPGGLHPPGKPAFARGQCRQVAIRDAMHVENNVVVGTSATLSLERTKATQWVFDFSKLLLLPWIDEVVCAWGGLG